MMAVDWTKVLPVVISMLIILAVAVLRKYSPLFATIAAVMPINIPLAVAIVYLGMPDEERAAQMPPFASGLAINLLPTFLFTVVVWWMFHQGYGLWITLIVSYIVWALGLGLLLALRAWLKF
ncbi:hypothetical protein HC776_01800 [bacterium]|nr:hypothetical protein [bacterium]